MKAIISLLFIFLISGCSGIEQHGKVNIPDKQTIEIGTGGPGGMYQRTGQEICRVINKNYSNQRISCITKKTKGSVSNIESIIRGERHFGLARSDRLYQASNGLGIWDGKPESTIRTILGVYHEPVHLVVDNDLSTIEDLKSKNVSIGKPGSVSNIDALATLNIYNINLNSINLLNLSREKAVEMFRKKIIDAFFYTTGDPSGFVEEATDYRKSNFIALKGVNIDRLIDKAPYYKKATIPKRWYQNIKTNKNTPSFGYQTIFFTNSNFSDEVIYYITKNIFNNLIVFQRRHPAFANLTNDNMTINIEKIAPIHNGAMMFYKEKGWR